MGSTVKALKELGKKCNTEHTEPDGTTISKVINSIAANFDITGAAGADGADGADGASVTALTLYVDDGVVTGGVATLSSGSSINITVTTTPTPSEP